jgi:hypothetical protein
MVRAGDASLTVESEAMENGEVSYRFVSTAVSSRFFSTFFKVHDQVVSVWSPTERVPLRFERHISEGSYKKDEVVYFDHARNLAVYEDGTEHEVPDGVQDVLSAFYAVRTERLQVGEVVHIANHASGKNYELDVRVLTRETVEVPAGTFDCFVVEPLLETAGLFKQEGRLTIWLTADARHMPVLMKSKVAVGSIVAELESFRLGRPPRWKGEAGVGETAAQAAEMAGKKGP